MPHPNVRLAAVLVSAAALACVSTGAASASPDRAKPLSHTQAVEARLLTQQGLAIALANGVLQGNLILSEFGFPGETGVKTGHCYDYNGIGVEPRKLAQPSKTKTVITNELYFDDACKKAYITQSATLTSSHGGNSLAAAESWIYHSPSGRALGTFTAKASVDDTDQGLRLRGLGRFRPTGSTTPVSLGLTCNTQATSEASTSTTWNCAGGIAQKFADLRLSLGSVTPLTLVVQDQENSSGFGRVDFRGTKATLRSGAGKLAVTLGKSDSLSLTGRSRGAGSDATKGSAAQFALFTPRPTGWTITAPKAHTAFSITVSSASLELAGKVVDIRSKAVLATVSVDRSGTGTIRYRGADPVKVISWLLAG